MRCVLLAALAVCLGAYAQAPEMGFSQPDGRWWLAARADQRGGFWAGFVDCDYYFLRHAEAADVKADVFEQAITQFYRERPTRESLAVTSVIPKLELEWRIKGYAVEHADPAKEFPGEAWRVLNRKGIILGFLACQSAESGFNPTVSPQELVNRVNAWYGTDDEGSINEKRAKDKLSKVILRAEQGAP